MTFTIDVQNDAGYAVDTGHLQRAAQWVLQQETAPENSSLTIVITDNEAVQKLNMRHLGIDAPTDVLSFPAEPLPPELSAFDDDDGQYDDEDSSFDDTNDTDDAYDNAYEENYLGDLIIAWPYATAQAEKHNHPLNDSLALLVVHGTLHLLGYDHDTPENRARMWAQQAQALDALQIDTAIVPTLEGHETGTYEGSNPHDE